MEPLIGLGDFTRQLFGMVTPQALLLLGPQGCGKRTMLAALGRMLMCQNPGPEGPCDACDACRKVAEGNHPDHLTLLPEADKKGVAVDSVRRAIDTLQYAPYAGGRRVVVFPDVDQARGDAQQVMLKSLEEPPEYAVWLLCASAQDKVLPTVRSRCRTLRVPPVPQGEIAAYLRPKGADPATAEAAAAMSGGAVGQALAWADQDNAALLRQALDQIAVLARPGVPFAQIAAWFAGQKGRHEAILALWEGEISRGMRGQGGLAQAGVARLSRMSAAISRAREAIPVNALGTAGIDALLMEMMRA